jgi:hypothetical protein
MFEQLFQRTYYVARHYAGPCSEERQLYLSHLISEGRSRSTLRQVAHLLISIARHLSIDRSDVTTAQIQEAAGSWLCSPHHKYSSDKSRRAAKTLFTFHATRWLRLLGHLHQPVSKRHFPSELDAFLRFQRDEQGLAPSTISRRHKYVSRFLTSLKPRVKILKRVALKDISGYFSSGAVHGWGAQHDRASRRGAARFLPLRGVQEMVHTRPVSCDRLAKGLSK